MRSKSYGINVRVTEQEKQKLQENARFCSLSLSEYLRRLGLGKEVKAAITERDYRLFRMLNGLKKELPQLQKEEIISRLEAVLNELKYPSIAILRRYAAMLVVPNCAIFVSIISRSCGVTRNLS